MSNTITLIDNEQFELALTTKMCGYTYYYYVNQNESDENASVKLYNTTELICDNYHAYNDLMETLEQIYHGNLTNYTMSDTMKYNYNEMIKNNYFD